MSIFEMLPFDKLRMAYLSMTKVKGIVVNDLTM